MDMRYEVLVDLDDGNEMFITEIDIPYAYCDTHEEALEYATEKVREYLLKTEIECTDIVVYLLVAIKRVII